MPRVYLDHNASTPCRPDVLEAMLPYFTEEYANPSSVHGYGQEAKGAVEEARARVASFLNAAPNEIVFTSGGTESDNLAVLGTARALAASGRHVVTSAVEHEAVGQACDQLEREGFTVTRVAPGRDGRVAPDAVAAALRDDTILVTIMAANNETGVIQPSAEIGAICAGRGIAYHVDAVQAAGKIPVDAAAWQATLLTITAHKFYGPKGAGVLVTRRGARLAPLLFGGEHERGRRPGTANVPAIVGLGAACEAAARDLATDAPRWTALRDRFEAGLVERVPNVVIHGAGAPRVGNTSHVSFVGAEGEHLVLSLDMKGIAVSAGAACKAGSSRASSVLLAMGVPAVVAQSAVRFSVGRDTTGAEIDRVLDVLPGVVAKLRAASPTLAA
ncbi:MAG TPA: cysteine desulfurase family protein [Acidobacteriota bacterium]|nr:cysteine desulfurase family protein [Acidobacteriota bacterium]